MFASDIFLDQVAPDPSHLMRSRYTAFVIKDADYTVKTGTPHAGRQFQTEIEAGFAKYPVARSYRL